MRRPFKFKNLLGAMLLGGMTCLCGRAQAQLTPPTKPPICDQHFADLMAATERNLIPLVDQAIQTEILQAAKRGGEKVAPSDVKLVSASAPGAPAFQNFSFVHVLTTSNAAIQFDSTLRRYYYELGTDETDNALSDSLGRIIQPATIRRCVQTAMFDSAISITNSSTSLNIGLLPFNHKFTTIREYPEP